MCVFAQAFSSFKMVASELNITNTSSLEDFRQAVETVCNMTLDEILDIPLTGRPEEPIIETNLFFILIDVKIC